MTDFEPQRFQPLFQPQSVAFIGASNSSGKWGYIILANLINGGYKKPIYPVNPRELRIQGLKAYPKVSDIPETPDLAVIVTPSHEILNVIDDCAVKGIPAAIVITAGFAEMGVNGERLQKEIAEKARRGKMLLVGPNCNGIIRPSSSLYPAMAPLFPPSGSLGIISQSGNVVTSIVSRGIKSGFGFSCCISSGNEALLHCEDYLAFMGLDPETKVVMLYIEGLTDGRSFLLTAKQVSRKKPIVVLKAGGTLSGAIAAKSHTGSLSGNDSLFDGMCRQTGMIRAKDLDSLFRIGAAFVSQPLPRGRRVGIITAGGGWGVLAADACARSGLNLAALPADTLSELESFLPQWWSRSNPIDLVGGLSAEDLSKSLETLLHCNQVDGVILLGIIPTLLLPTLKLDSWVGASQPGNEMTSRPVLELITEAYDQFMRLAYTYQKPVIIGSEFTVRISGLESQMARALGRSGYICYGEPGEAAAAMAALATYGEYLTSGG